MKLSQTNSWQHTHIRELPAANIKQNQRPHQPHWPLLVGTVLHVHSWVTAEKNRAQEPQTALQFYNCIVY